MPERDRRRPPAEAAAARSYGAVFCGGGPAAIGAVVCAAETGRLEELLASGIAVVEQGSVLGPGAIGHYRINGNTFGSTFLACLDGPAAEVLGDLAEEPSAQELRRLGATYPPLPLVGVFLERLGERIERLLEAHPSCTVLRRTSVLSVRLCEVGVHVAVRPLDAPPAELTVAAGHAVLAMGGCEPPEIERRMLLPGLTLETYAEKVCHASALIDDRLSVPDRLAERVRETGAAVVVGGSHSAWSAAVALLQDPAFRTKVDRPPTITVVHRQPLRFFYTSSARARAAGLAFEERDVCPSTGYVHRHGGLRGDAHALARTVVGAEHASVRTLRLHDDAETRRELERVLDAAGLVVAGVGYHPRLPTLLRRDGRPLEPMLSEDGLLVTPDARLVAADGTVVPELVAYGLGAGLSALGELAGEPSYTGRVDAVRLYQAEAGRIVLDALLDRAAARPAVAAYS